MYYTRSQPDTQAQSAAFDAPQERNSAHRRKKLGGKNPSSLLKQACSHLFCDDGLDDLDLAAIVVTALLAHSVRQVQRTAFGACNETGDRQLPVRAAALVASCFGYFSLRYCHCDTSLIIQRPGVPSLLFISLDFPKVLQGFLFPRQKLQWLGQQSG